MRKRVSSIAILLAGLASLAHAESASVSGMLNKGSRQLVMLMPEPSLAAILGVDLLTVAAVIFLVRRFAGARR